MDVQQLRCFLAVAAELHFGRAAERLHLTPSPVSRAVKDLEREIGAELFVRRYHQVDLTAAGRRLAELAGPLLADFDRLTIEVQAVAAESRMVVRLAGTHLAPASILDAVVGCAEKACPDRVVEVAIAPSSELLPALARGDLDAAVVHLPLSDPDLSSLPLASYSFHAAMRSDDPLALRDEIAVAELAGHTLVSIAPTVQPLAMARMRDELVAQGITRFHILPVADTVLVAAHVRSTGSVTLTLSLASGAASSRVFDDPAFAVVPLTDSPDFHLGLAWATARRDDGAVGPVVDAVQELWGGAERAV
jgi:DNA-binding transcriptional LysR family regulator